MRSWALVPVVAVLLSAGAAAAQSPGDLTPGIAVEIKGFEAPIQPLDELAATNVTVTVSCTAVADTAVTPKEVRLVVTRLPEWTSATVSPSTFLVDVKRCTGTTWQGNAELFVATTNLAPAFSPDDIVVQAKVAGPTETLVGEATTTVQAGYFSIVDVVAETTILRLEPGQQASYHVTLHNFGNGPTKFVPQVRIAPDGWEVAPPPPVTLESRPTGGTVIDASVVLHVRPQVDRGFVNAVEAVVLDVETHYSLDPSFAGDNASLSFLTSVKGFDTPAPGVVVLPAAAVAALLLGRRRSNRAPATI